MIKRTLVTLGILLMIYLPIQFGTGYIVGFIVGFIVANIILFSNNASIVSAITFIGRGRQSTIKMMLNEDVENEKRYKVKYKK
jgi:hypothetical protein